MPRQPDLTQNGSIQPNPTQPNQTKANQSQSNSTPPAQPTQLQIQPNQSITYSGLISPCFVLHPYEKQGLIKPE